jgi:DNA repair exonuclease SbcCD nuclease subunit
MYRRLITADLQLKKGPRFEDALRSLDFMIGYAREAKVNEFIILGDIYEKADIVAGSVEEVEFTKRILQLVYGGIYVYILLGNHDISDQDNHLFKTLASLELEGLYVIDEPMCLGNMIFVPYFHKYCATAAGLSMRSLMVNTIDGLVLKCEDRPHLLMLHCDIVDAEPEKGKKIKTDALQKEDFKKWNSHVDFCFSGHIHKHQVIGPRSKPSIVYVGSPLHTTFASGNDEKGFVVFEEENDHRGWEFHQIPQRTQLEYQWDLSKDLEIEDGVRGANVKIKVVFSRRAYNLKRVKLLEESLYESGAYHVSIVPVQKSVSDVNNIITEETTDVDSFVEYINHTIDDDNLAADCIEVGIHYIKGEN